MPAPREGIRRVSATCTRNFARTPLSGISRARFRFFEPSLLLVGGSTRDTGSSRCVQQLVARCIIFLLLASEFAKERDTVSFRLREPRVFEFFLLVHRAKPD